jgi:hypothetical protein
MTRLSLVRLFVALLLLLQLASVHAFTTDQRAAMSTASEHCATHVPTAPGSMPADTDCCQQLAGCHCPQAPAAQPLVVALTDVFEDDVPTVRLGTPPALPLVDELFRPPI